MWDPEIGLGTVSHQTIGYLFPMGPFFWVLEQAAGMPSWVAQRLWLATLLFAAGTGVWYLLKTLGLRGPGVAVGVLAYTFTPYVLQYSSRFSVILGPWAALGWMIAFVVLALRRGGWKYPALFAITVQLVGSVNATALLFAGLGPLLVIPYSVVVLREASSAARLAGGVAHRPAHARHLAVVDVGALGAGELRTRRPEVHRDGRDGLADLVRERDPARPRLLVLLLQGPHRTVERRRPRHDAVAVADLRQLLGPGARPALGRRRALARPRVLRAARARRHDRRRRRVAVRQPVDPRFALQGLRSQLVGGSRAPQHVARGPARRARARRPPRRRRDRARRPPGPSPTGLDRDRPRRRGRRAGAAQRAGSLERPALQQLPRARRGRAVVLVERVAVPRLQAARHPRPRAPRIRLRRLPVGRHDRPDRARPHGPALRRARARAVGLAALGRVPRGARPPGAGRPARARRPRPGGAHDGRRRRPAADGPADRAVQPHPLQPALEPLLARATEGPRARRARSARRPRAGPRCPASTRRRSRSGPPPSRRRWPCSA